ncbi:MAG: MTH938/NDUFAF3 family protein [Granulosicoccus sp.]
MHLETSEHNLISNYGPGVLGINSQDYTGNVLVTRSRVVEHWYEGVPADIKLEHFGPLLEDTSAERPEIILLGTGNDHIFPPMQLLAELKAEGMTLEVMNTRAACRTYSVLVSEYRSVAAALLQIGK